MNNLIAKLQQEPLNGEYHTICVDGRGGSGKSTVGHWLVSRALEGFVLSEGDDYLEPFEHPIVPGYFNAERFMIDVGSSLKAGDRRLTYKPFTWPGKPTLPHRVLEVGKGVVHEGVLAFDLPVDWDVKIWVNTPRELALERYFTRTEAQRRALNRTPEQIMAAGLEWARQADEYIARVDPLNTADFVVDGTLQIEQQL